MESAPAPGLIIAAPSSGSGKTVLTLGLLRYLASSGVQVASAKAGPDYIDPAFHAAATGRACLNLDPWAMGDGSLNRAVAQLGRDAEIIVCEGVMGLFDGATIDSGSTADLSARTGWPVVLVIDSLAQGASAAAVLRGFASHRPDVPVAGVIFNRVAGDKHAGIVTDATRQALPEIPVLGCLPRTQGLSLPDRHLGLVQAVEHPDLEGFIDKAAGLVAQHVDVAALKALARPWEGQAEAEGGPAITPPGQKIAVARDQAFAFCYPLTLDGWRRAGAELSFFSPLENEAPVPNADAVYLPGGYPELHAGRLAGNQGFLDGLRTAAGGGAAIFGECGGYMVLGRGLVDATGTRHAMAGLLPLETSFAERQLHLGYRRAVLGADTAVGTTGEAYRGHEFHYATILDEGPGTPLFDCVDAAGKPLGPAGRIEGRVMGSFIHLIDRETA
ncbi:MAG: cobyrinate a,c-diamide synthase [Rhodospirillales bacterium]|nr:cobyrinate a,c-diamide synthase [Rhodospirillales bacterium]